jgi:Na+/H+ antiporter NhaC
MKDPHSGLKGRLRFGLTLRRASLRVAVALTFNGFVSVTAFAQTITKDPASEFGWLTLLPVVVALAVALILRQIIPAIFAGLWVGAFLVHGFGIKALWLGLLDTVSVYILEALTDPDRMSIILFSLMIGGLVGILNKNGGMEGIVNSLTRFASTRQRGQLATSFLGTAIFFDDYANTMVVGNTMRPITDRLNISREKLSYLVDSTAAPIASIAFITTWIGFQVGLISDAASGLDGLSENAYSIFLNSIPYSFYSILAVVFVYLVAATGRDFGPMLRAEKKALLSGVQGLASTPKSDAHIEPVQNLNARTVKASPLNAILPLAILIFGTLIGIYTTGRIGLPSEASLRDIIGNGNSYRAMIWASSLAVMAAAALSVGGRQLSLSQTVEAWLEGVKSMMFAIVVLTLAWSLAGVNEVLHTADFLAALLSGHLPPWLLPTVIFLLAAAMAFATGSSWGVMGILIPLTVPLAWSVLATNGQADANMGIFYASIAALLSGAVWGDHCSPISDTTILSSMASDCDHLAHVKTQLPYAILVAGVAVLVGSIPAGFGVSPWLSLGVSTLALAGFLFAVGKRPQRASGESGTGFPSGSATKQ